MQQLRRQLQQHPGLAALRQAPDAVLAALRADPALRDAARADPALASLLQPATLQAALRALEGGALTGAVDACAGADGGAYSAAGAPHAAREQLQQLDDALGGSAPTERRKALMQLQGYAQSLLMQRVAGDGRAPATPFTADDAPARGAGGAAAGTDQGAGGMPPARAGGADARKAAFERLQMQLGKLKQRAAHIGASGAGAGALSGLPGPSAAYTSAPAATPNTAGIVSPFAALQGQAEGASSRSNGGSGGTGSIGGPFAVGTGHVGQVPIPPQPTKGQVPHPGAVQAASGEWVVDVSPPTCITTRVSFSTDPSAEFLLEAASSGVAPSSFPEVAAGPRVADGAGTLAGADGGASGGAEGDAVAAASAALAAALSKTPRLTPEGGVAAVGGSGSGSAAGSAGGSLASYRGKGRGSAGSGWVEAAPAVSRTASGGWPAGLGLDACGSAAGSKGRQPASALAPSRSAGASAAACAAAWASGPRGGGSGPTFNAYGFASGADDDVIVGPSLDPRTYYEAVAPSDWKPSDEEDQSCIGLYRRAYCTHADALFPPLWLALVGALTHSGLLPFWGLALAAAGSFLLGLRLVVVGLAGVQRSQLPAARAAPSAVASLEVLFAGVVAFDMLPAAWMGMAGGAAATLAACCAVIGLHLRTYLLDPGFIPLPPADQRAHWQGAVTAGEASGARSQCGTKCGAAPCKDAAAAEGADAALLPLSELTGAAATITVHGRGGGGGGNGAHDQVAVASEPSGGGRGARGAEPAAAACSSSACGSGACGKRGAGRALNGCWTCGVERNLRSKHCPFCRRCVERLDHHCFIMGNCVGAGNQRTFLLYLLALVGAHLLFIRLAVSLLIRDYSKLEAAAAHAALSGGAAAAAAAPVAQGLALACRALWAARAARPGWLLLLLLAAPTLAMAAALLARHALAAAANVTVNEWVNRGRYMYLRHESAGYCNRFDRGVAYNCWEFWAMPGGAHRDWWAAWESGDREMVASNSTVLVRSSLTAIVRFADASWARFRKQLLESRQRRAEARIQRRLRALGLDGAAGGGGGACSRRGGGAAQHQCARCDA